MHVASHPNVPDGIAIFLDEAQQPIDTVIWPNHIALCSHDVAFILLSPDDYDDLMAWVHWREVAIEMDGATIH